MMRTKLCTFALVVGLSPIAMVAPYAAAQDRDNRVQQNGDRDDQNRNGTWGTNNLQNALHQRVPNSNIAVSYQNNNTVVMTGTAATERDRQYAEQMVRSQVGNARVIDQVSVNGYNSAYPNSYPNNGSYSNGDRDADRDRARTDNDRDNRTDVDRDRARTDNDQYRNDNDQARQANGDRDRDNQQMSDKDRRYHDKKHKDKDKKNKNKKDKDDRGDHDSDNRPQ